LTAWFLSTSGTVNTDAFAPMVGFADGKDIVGLLVTERSVR
jgi:hypothetical protein